MMCIRIKIQVNENNQKYMKTIREENLFAVGDNCYI